MVALPKYGSFTPVIYGYNKYGTLIDLNVENVIYECDSEVGTIKDDGTFFADGSQNGLIKVKWNQLETFIRIKYLKEESELVLSNYISGHPKCRESTFHRLKGR